VYDSSILSLTTYFVYDIYFDIFISEITYSVDDSLISFVITYPVYHSRLKFDQSEFVLVYDCQLKFYQ
jgi:hypothetical protein